VFDARRREIITLLGGAAASWPLAARAQQARKVPMLGFLGQSTPSGESERAAAFAQRLRELGWAEGRTIAIEYRWAAGRNERLAEIAAEFVQLKIDVIVAGGTPPVLAAMQATSITPIVFAWRETQWAQAWWQVWLGPAATSPASPSWRSILPASGSTFCARSSPGWAAWRSWGMSPIRLS
jgi:hypothetical protein